MTTQPPTPDMSGGGPSPDSPQSPGSPQPAGTQQANALQETIAKIVKGLGDLAANNEAAGISPEIQEAQNAMRKAFTKTLQAGTQPAQPQASPQA